METLYSTTDHKTRQETARVQEKQKSKKKDAEDKETYVLQKASITYDLNDNSLGRSKFFFVAEVVESYINLTLFVVCDVWCGAL